MKRTWRDVDEIALDLVERHPMTDPFGIGLDELKQLVIALPTFGDDPNTSTTAQLEAIQAAWYDEFED
jgi:FeS assembly protein IscX